MSAEASNDPEAIANGAEENQQTADASLKAADESPAKPNGEPEAQSNAAESPSKNLTPKKGAKGAKAKNEADSEKLATPKHDDTDDKPQSATKGKSKESSRIAPAETASPSGAFPSFAEATESGKRERRKIERFADRTSVEEENKLRRKSELLAKSGVSLGEIERVAYFIARAEPDGLKLLHGIIYDRPGTSKELRTNLRQFRGFAFDADSPDYKSRLHRLKERHVKELRNACFALDIERSGNRDDLALRIIQFLLKPVDSGEPVPQSAGKNKRKSAGGAKTGRKTKASTSAKETANDGEEEKHGAKEEDDEESSTKSESGSEKKGKAAAKSRKSPTKATPTAAKKSATPKAKAKASPTKKRKAESDSDSLSDSDESAPPASASKKARSEKEKSKAAEVKADPVEEQLARAVESILADADLTKTTIKVVLEQISSRFPDVELTAERKSFVRLKVRELIVAKSDASEADAGAEVKSASTSATGSPAKK